MPRSDLQTWPCPSFPQPPAQYKRHFQFWLRFWREEDGGFITLRHVHSKYVGFNHDQVLSRFMQITVTVQTLHSKPYVLNNPYLVGGGANHLSQVCPAFFPPGVWNSRRSAVVLTTHPEVADFRRKACQTKWYKVGLLSKKNYINTSPKRFVDPNG